MLATVSTIVATAFHLPLSYQAQLFLPSTRIVKSKNGRQLRTRSAIQNIVETKANVDGGSLARVKRQMWEKCGGRLFGVFVLSIFSAICLVISRACLTDHFRIRPTIRM